MCFTLCWMWEKTATHCWLDLFVSFSWRFCSRNEPSPWQEMYKKRVQFQINIKKHFLYNKPEFKSKKQADGGRRVFLRQSGPEMWHGPSHSWGWKLGQSIINIVSFVCFPFVLSWKLFVHTHTSHVGSCDDVMMSEVVKSAAGLRWCHQTAVKRINWILLNFGD